MPLNYQQMLVQDFAGGITDRYINAANNAYREADNFVITEYGTLEVRDGSAPIYNSESFEPIMGILELNDEIFVVRGAQLYLLDQDAGALSLVPKPQTGGYLQIFGTSSYPSYVEWRNQLHVINTGTSSPLAYNRPMRTWRDDLGALQSSELGLPAFDGTNITATPNPDTTAGNLADRSYLYSFIYTYTYKVGDVTYTNVSEVHQEGPVVLTNSRPIGDLTASVSISGWPTLSTVGTQLDDSNIKIEVYRTTDGGTLQYFVQELPVDQVAAWVDNNTDETITSNKTLYTTGGFVEHHQAPKCRAMTAVNDIMYFGGVLEEIDAGDQLRPYRIQQSIPGVPSATNPTYYTDLDDDVVGMNHYKGIPMAFTASYIYRIEGQIDALGAGNIRPRAVSSDAGCLSHNGIVRTDFGIYWAGKNGFYRTDGYNIELLTRNLTKRYSEYSDEVEKIGGVVGTYDKENERVVWGMSEDGVGNDKLWVFDIKAGEFTTASGEQMIAASLHYNKNRIFRGDDFGYIYEHASDYTSDLMRDITKPVSEWRKAHIPFYFESVAYDMGNAHTRKWVQQATFSISTGSDASITPYSNNDDAKSIKVMKEIGIRGFITWGDENFVWGNPDTVWRPAETTVYQRHFPRGHARCRRKQVRLQAERVTLFRSDIYGTCDIAYENPININPTRLTATLSGTDTWPVDIENEMIAFDHDGYSNELVIESRSDQTLVIVGSLGSGSVGAGKKWHIKGYKKDQRWELKGISMTFAPLDNQGNKFDQSDSKDNA